MSSHVGSIVNHTASKPPNYKEKIYLHGKGVSGLVGMFNGALRDSSSDLPLTFNCLSKKILEYLPLSLVCQTQHLNHSPHLSV